jgi:hypothetical protein
MRVCLGHDGVMVIEFVKLMLLAVQVSPLPACTHTSRNLIDPVLPQNIFLVLC